MGSTPIQELQGANAGSTVVAPLNFSIDTGVKPVNKTVGPGGRLRERTGGGEDWRPTVIADVRPAADGLSLDREGFVLVSAPTAVEDFWSEEQRRDVYEPEVSELIARLSGAQRVVVFDQTLRSTDPTRQQEAFAREPVQIVHNDYTHRSGPWRLVDVLGEEEAERARQGRFCIIQVWRPCIGPLHRFPLALCDARTLRPQCLIPADRVHPNRVGEIYQVAHDPQLRWYYVPAMQPDEAIVFKVYDSLEDGRARFTAHTAFEHPDTPDDAPPRESIEIRALALFT
jgi:hypothetical protein